MKATKQISTKLEEICDVDNRRSILLEKTNSSQLIRLQLPGRSDRESGSRVHIRDENRDGKSYGSANNEARVQQFGQGGSVGRFRRRRVGGARRFEKRRSDDELARGMPIAIGCAKREGSRKGRFGGVMERMRRKGACGKNYKKKTKRLKNTRSYGQSMDHAARSPLDLLSPSSGRPHLNSNLHTATACFVVVVASFLDASSAAAGRSSVARQSSSYPLLLFRLLSSAARRSSSFPLLFRLHFSGDLARLQLLCCYDCAGKGNTTPTRSGYNAELIFREAVNGKNALLHVPELLRLEMKSNELLICSNNHRQSSLYMLQSHRNHSQSQKQSSYAREHHGK
ncbi:hypothetical protein LXL04_013288 [Taraxacum kok-saghyz]